MNIVDSLIVTLGLDATPFAKGAKDAEVAFTKTRDSATKTGKTIEASGKGAAEAISKIRDQAIELFAIFLGGKGLKEFIGDVTKANTALGNLSSTIGVQGSSLDAIGKAVESAGGSYQAGVESVRSFTQSLAELAITGTSAIVPYLRSLQAATGVDLTTKGKTTLEVLEHIADALKKVKDTQGAGEATKMASLLGFNDPAEVKLLEEGGKAFAAAVAQTKKYASSPADIDAAEKLTKAFTLLSDAAVKLGRNLMTFVSPGLVAIADGIRHFMDVHPERATAIFDGLAGAVTLLGVGLGTMITASMFSAAAGGIKLMGTAAATATGLLGTLLSTLTGIVAAATAIGFIHEGAEGGFNWLMDKLGVLKHDPGQDFSALGDAKRVLGDITGSGGGSGKSGSSPSPSSPSPSAGGSSGKPDPSKPLFAFPGTPTSGGPSSFNDTNPGLSAAIIAAEGTGMYKGKPVNPYDTALNYVNFKDPPPKPLSQMTNDEVMAYAARHRWANSTAKGAFQIENSTQKAAMHALGLKGSDLYSPQNQVRMRDWIAKTQGVKPSTWQGFAAHPDQLARAKAAWAHRSATSKLFNGMSIPASVLSMPAHSSSLTTTNNNQSSNVNATSHFTVNVPPGTNPDGIVGALRGAVARNSLAMHANYGIT